MKILLIAPPFTEQVLEMAAKESIGMCYLAAVLRQDGFQVTLLDADLLGLDVDQTINEICKEDNALLGFSVLEGTIESTAAILNGLKSRQVKSHVVLGGYLPTLIPEEVLNGLDRADSVLLGDAEYALLDLARCLRDSGDWRKVAGLACRGPNSVVINPHGKAFELDDLPFPVRDLLPEVLSRGGVTGIVGSRGCFDNCAFCCISRFNKNGCLASWRGRNPVSIVDEMVFLSKSRGIHSFSFYDSTFVGPGHKGLERAYAIGKEILQRDLQVSFAFSARPDQVDRELFAFLKKAGLTEVFIGIENMSQPVLDRFNKRITVQQNIRAIEILEELDIKFRPGFILYDPLVTLEQIKDNMRYLWQLNNSRNCQKFYFFKALRIYRGSPLEATFDQKGILLPNGWHRTYRWQDPQVGRFVHLTGMLAAKMVPLIQKTRVLDQEARDYFDGQLGKWNLTIHEQILEMIERGETERDRYIQIAMSAEKKLNKIENTIKRYAAAAQYGERRVAG